MINFEFLQEGINAGRFQAVIKGAKVSDETRPELVINVSMNKMCINGKASEMLGIETGDYMRALVLKPEHCENDLEKKFYIMVSHTKSDAMVTLASVGKQKGIGRKLFCTYAACYSQFLQNTLDAKAISPERLVELGFAYSTDKIGKDGKPYTKFTASREVHYLIEATGVSYQNSDNSVSELYVCRDAKIIERSYESANAEDSENDEAVEAKSHSKAKTKFVESATNISEDNYSPSTQSDETGI